MPNLLSLLRPRRAPAPEARMSLGDYFTYLGTRYPFGFASTATYGEKQEAIENSFAGYVQGAYKADGVVFACSVARMLVFAEARFQWQQMRGGRPGDLFGDQTLGVLERPWPNGTTGELLSRAMQDTDFGGNFYVARDFDVSGRARLRRLRPDWTQIVLTAPPDEAVASDVVGYRYTPGGATSKAAPVMYAARDVAHWSPIPDPDAQYRGMSWLTPVLREIQADMAATRHKLKFFENAATPNLAVSLKETVTVDQFKEFMAMMNAAHQGVDNAYKTLYLGGGADVTVVGADLKQLDFKATQGAGETRIAAAAGVHPVIVGLSEGMQGSSLNAGNFATARRRFADGTIRPLWRSIAAALETVVPPPNGARLWYDDRDIPFLREDAKDSAAIVQIKAASIRQLIDGGYDPASVTAAVDSEDLSLLKHTGNLSVQLQPPGTPVDDAPTAPTEGEDTPDE